MAMIARVKRRYRNTDFLETNILILRLSDGVPPPPTRRLLHLNGGVAMVQQRHCLRSTTILILTSLFVH